MGGGEIEEEVKGIRIKMYYFKGSVSRAGGRPTDGIAGGRDTRLHVYNIRARGRQEVVFKWITVPPPTRPGKSERAII